MPGVISRVSEKKFFSSQTFQENLKFIDAMIIAAAEGVARAQLPAAAAW
jgi:hypothetical protein